MFKKEILPHIEDLLPSNWQTSDDGTKSIFLLASLANFYPVRQREDCFEFIVVRVFAQKIFSEDYFQSHWNESTLPLGKTTDEQATIKKCLQVRLDVSPFSSHRTLAMSIEINQVV